MRYGSMMELLDTESQTIVSVYAWIKDGGTAPSIATPTEIVHESHLVYNVHMGAPVQNTSAMIHVRVDQNLKTKASEALDAMGLSLSDVVRLLLTRIAVEQALPFEVRVPNAVTRAAMEDLRRGHLFTASSVREL